MVKRTNEDNTVPAMKPGVIRTYTGKTFNVFDPDPELIDIRDIAHSLSNLCRYGGHTSEFYSVAEHSVRVMRIVPPEHRLAALLHDASEAYLVDLPSPVKYSMPDYLYYEKKLMSVIAEKFGFQYPFDPVITDADKIIQQNEWLEFIVADREYYMTPFHPGLARKIFRIAFRKYIKKQKS